MYKQKRRKNEIVAQCTSCHKERVVAYWDGELECYIYLSDEPICRECMECTVIAEEVYEGA